MPQNKPNYKKLFLKRMTQGFQPISSAIYSSPPPNAFKYGGGRLIHVCVVTRRIASLNRAGLLVKRVRSGPGLVNQLSLRPCALRLLQRTAAAHTWSPAQLFFYPRRLPCTPQHSPQALGSSPPPNPTSLVDPLLTGTCQPSGKSPHV